MEKFSFFNDINDDRIYYAEDFARHLKKYFTNGIFNNELQVISNNDMTVTIQSGDANIEGYRYTNTDNLVKNIDVADGQLSRIDNVVIRLDLTNRLISAQIVKGSFDENPIAPPLERSTTIYDIKLAEIKINAGATAISQEDIKDTRFDTNLCGNVISTVQTPDTTDLFIQYDAAFNDWFESVKDTLSEDAAGNLLTKINELTNKLNENTDNEWEVIEIDDADLENWEMEE